MVKKTEKTVETKVEKTEVDADMDGGAKKKVKKAAVAKSVAATKTKAGKKSSKGSKSSKKSSGKSAAKGEKKNERYFKLIDEKTFKSHGRYTGDTPKQAASKGYTKLLQKLKDQGKPIPKTTTIYLRESTRNRNRKVYGYSASRVKLPEPQELVIADKETGKEKTITYNYRNKIKKVAVPEQLGGAVRKAKGKKAAGSKSKKSASKATKKAAGSKTAKKATGTKKAAGKASKKSKKASK